MKRVIYSNLALVTLICFVSLVSCSRTNTYSLSEAAGFEVSDISKVLARASMGIGPQIEVLPGAYKYFDCEYIKTDFDIEEHYQYGSPNEEDDAYQISVKIDHIDYYKDFGLSFYVSHNTKYMYMHGLDATYRSKDVMPPLFIDLIDYRANEFVKYWNETITADYGEIEEGKVTIMYGDCLFPQSLLDMCKEPFVAGDEIEFAYAGEVIKEGKKPSIIREDKFELLDVEVHNALVVPLKVSSSLLDESKTLYPTGKDGINRMLTRYCINKDMTFTTIDDLEIGTIVYATVYKGDGYAFYTYKPLTY